MAKKAGEARILVSACLAGCRSRYDGGVPKVVDAHIRRWKAAGRVILFCPETAGGLPTPRDPAEISGGFGQDVLAGRRKVFNCRGEDVTVYFLAGAQRALAAVKLFNIRAAVLKDGSPSCGTTRIYDGTFHHRQVVGQGVTAALLAAWQVALFNEHNLALLEN